jgi:hypothetical protein
MTARDILALPRGATPPLLEEQRPPMTPNEISARAGAHDFVPAPPLAAHQRDYKRIAGWVKFYSGVDLSASLRSGCDIFFRGPAHARYAPNHASARAHSDHVSRQVEDYLREGVIQGPFVARPFPRDQLAVSPLGAVPKGISGVRVIMDMSASHINEHVQAPSFSYKKVDKFLSGITKHSFLFKVDIHGAFLQVSVRPEDYHLCAFRWNSKFYFFSRLPFGCKSSPWSFCRYADAVRDGFSTRWGPVFDFDLSSFSDDSFASSEDYDTLCAVFTLWCQTLAACGLPTSTKAGKCVPPCRAIDLLGLRVDVTANSVALMEEKRVRWFPLINSWLGSCVFRKELERMIGILTWCGTIQPLCRPFIGPFRDLFHSRALSAEWSDGGQLWRPLEQLLPDECTFVRDLLASASCSRRLYRTERETITCVFSDAALSTGLAGAASSDGHIERFDCNASLASGLVSDINELECEGTLLAGLAWAKTRTQDGARLVLFSDNSPTVGWLRKGRVPARPYLNSLLQQLALVAARRSLSVVVAHVPGKKNSVADAISRNKPLTAAFWSELAAFEAAALLAGCDA